jgi:broad specificity phosphatase PhoE
VVGCRGEGDGDGDDDTMRLILIRHGQTASNVEGKLDTGIPGPGLTPLGTAQAAAIPSALEGESIEVLVASDMLRTQETIAPLAEATGLEVLVRGGIREISAGYLEMRNDEEAVELYLDTVMAWADGDFEPFITGGEHGRDAMARFDEVVGEIARTGVDTAVFVSHGAMIRTWAAWVSSNVDADYAGDHGLSNTAIVVLEGSPEHGWVTLTWSGEPLGGLAVTDDAADGPAADEV